MGGSEPGQAAPPSPGRLGLVRRWGPWALIAVAVIVAGSIGVQRTSHPSLAARTQSLANQVRCPVCEGQSVAQSQAPPALAIDNTIHQELAAGESPHAILTGIVGSYGPSILEKPPAKGVDLVVWIVPIVAVVVAAAGLGLAFRRWRPGAVRNVGTTDRDRQLVDEALAATPPLSTGGSPPEGS